MRPKTYFLRPDVAIPLGFALLREIWNQKVGGWAGRRHKELGIMPGIGSRDGWVGRPVWGTCPSVLITLDELIPARGQRWCPGGALSCPQHAPCGSLRQPPAPSFCCPILLQVVGRPDAYVMPAAAAK